MRTIVSLIIVILATGQSADATASPDADAEILYVEGQEAYDHADYATAIQRWRRSYEISGEPGLLFNLAQALRLSGDCAAALETYRRFIAADPDPSEQHRLATDLTKELEAACRSTLTRTADLVPGTEAPPHDHVDQGRRPGRALRTTGLMTSGAGALLLVTGLVVGQHARSLGDDVTTACAVTCDWNEQQSKEAAGRRYTVVGYALDAVGVVAIAGGAIMYYIGARQNVAVAPPLNARGAVVSWSRSW